MAVSTAYVNQILPKDAARVAIPGHVIQVLQGRSTARVTNSSSSPISAGCPVTITPISATSKILISWHMFYANNSDKTELHLMRNSTAIGGGSDAFIYFEHGPDSYAAGYSGAILSGNYLDSPNTTSAITYDLFFKDHSNGTMYANGRGNYPASHFPAYIIVQEIAQ